MPIQQIQKYILQIQNFPVISISSVRLDSGLAILLKNKNSFLLKGVFIT